MKENVFMCSMYFLIPLTHVKQEYRFKKMPWEDIPSPPYVKNAGGLCQYIPWGFDKNLEYYFRSHSMKSAQRLIRKIGLKCFLLRYKQSSGIKKNKYFFMVGASIDKLFPACDNNPNTALRDLMCTKNDLVCLKKAFYETETRGFLRTDRKTQKDFHVWLNDTIAEITGSEHTTIQLKYSIVDIIGLDVDNINLTTKISLDEAFSKAYYSENTPSVQEALSGNNVNFAYGLLMGDDNYRRVPVEEVHNVLNDGYSNNISEVTYAANDTIILLHTHHAFIFRPKNLNRQKRLNPTPSGIQNTFEMCDVICSKQKMQHLQHQLSHSDASTIKETLIGLSSFVNSDLYHVSGLDRKMDYFYLNMGINKELEQLSQISNLASSVEEIRVNQRTNSYIILLAVLTAFLSFVQIIVTLTYK